MIMVYTFILNKTTSPLLIKGFPSFKSLTNGIWPYGKLMIGIGMMAYLEVLVFRLDYFFASFLPEQEFAALLSLGNIDDLFFILPIGIAIPMTTYVGKAVGAKNIPKIKALLKMITIIACSLAATVLALFVNFRTEITQFYTTDPQVLRIMARLTIIWIIGYPLDFA